MDCAGCWLLASLSASHEQVATAVLLHALALTCISNSVLVHAITVQKASEFARKELRSAIAVEVAAVSRTDIYSVQDDGGTTGSCLFLHQEPKHRQCPRAAFHLKTWNLSRRQEHSGPRSFPAN